MRPVRFTGKPKPPIPDTVPIPAPEPPSFSLSRAPGQHEDIIERLKNGFKEVLRMLDDLKERKDIRVIVELDTSVQKEILEVVQRIEEKLDTSGISKEEEDRLAQELDTSSNALAEAIEANQPKSDNVSVAPKKKKKKST